MSTAVSSPGKASATARLLWRGSWRHARSHRWQTWLSVAGVMLGVMMVVAVDLANSSARRAFELSVATLSGNLTHQIVPLEGGTLDDSLYSRLRNDLGIRTSAPNVSGEVFVAGQSFTLLGVDLLSEATLQRRRPGFAVEENEILGFGLQAMAQPRGILMQGEAAAALGLEPDDTVSLRAGSRETDTVLAAVIDGEDSRAMEGVIFADHRTRANCTRTQRHRQH